MAMTSASLRTRIKTKMQAKNTEFAGRVGDVLDWLIDSVAEAVVEEIQGNAQVVVTSVSGVTTGGGTSGPGTGTVT